MQKVSTRILKLPRFGAEVLNVDRAFRSSQTWRLASAAVGALVGLLVLAGYALGLEVAWRLRPNLPAIHPYTALCIVLLALGLMPYRRVSQRYARPFRYAARGAVVVAILLLMIRVAVPLSGARLFEMLTPFMQTVTAQRAAGMTLTMGTVVAWTLLLVGLGEAWRWARRPVLSQVFGAAALSLLFMAATAYLAGLHPFFGTMAPTTLIASASLAIALLFATARHGFMRGLTASSMPGRLARILLGSSTVFILLIGWVVSRRIDAPGIPLPADGELLIYETALMLAWTWTIVTLTTMRADRLDRYRGLAGRLLERSATRDALTGLLTRNQLIRVRPKDERQKPRRAAHLLIDLDRFRTVNEAFGPDEGDKVLVEVAHRLRGVAASHAVGRLGGNEFAMVCAEISLADAERLGAAIVQALALPFDIKGHTFRLSASIGIAHGEHAAGANTQQAADDAMHVAKGLGGNQCVVFKPEMHETRRQQVELEQDLHEALRRDGELSLHFQPVVRVKDHQLSAIEALARWEHPRLGSIPPDRFIRIAEASGLIVPLGRKLMQLAVEQAAAWEAERPGSCPLMNINVSPAQFAGSDVVGDLVELMAQHGLKPEGFCLEITESVFAAAPAVCALERARALGFKVAMDDFGVGYSTLSQLPRLPLTSIKLDRSFIVNATETEGDAAIFAAITKLAHDLKLIVVAEGVETSAQLDLVIACGCDAVQGYLLARPMRPEALKMWLEQRYTGDALTDVLA